jgi:hypothetical protein
MLISSPATLLNLLCLFSTTTAAKTRGSKPLLNKQRAEVLTRKPSSNSSSGVSLEILTKTGVKNATAPLLYGWMFEDINHSGDGGLYGELLTNRGLEGSNWNWGSVPDYPFNSPLPNEENPVLTGGMKTSLHV